MDVEPVDLRGVNCYVVDDETLVDAGWRWSSGAIEDAVERRGIYLEDIERVLVTHYDVDHVGGLAGLAERGLDATVYMGEPDGSFLRGTDKPPYTNGKGIFQRLAGALGVTTPELDVESMEDGDEVGGFEVVETPGHTPGHVCYISEHAGFVGDAGRGDGAELEPMPGFMNYDSELAARSLRDLGDRLADVDLVYPGHGEVVQQG